MKQTSLWSGKDAGARFSLFGAALALVCLVGYCIYGAVYDYFDTVVFGGIVLGILFAGLYFLSDTAALGVFNLLSVLCLSAALGLFFLNSFPVWADRLNNITMYASRGGLEPVIAIMVVLIVCILAEIISCFLKKGGSKA